MRRFAFAFLLLLIAGGIALGGLGGFRVTPVFAAAAVASVSPGAGPTGGGTSVTITGTGFTGCTNASFGGAGVSVSPTGDTQIVVSSPASPLPAPGTGTVDVTVTGCPRGNSSPTPSDKFTYTSGGTGGGAVSFSGQIYVVDPTGNDANSCILATSGLPATFACATIQAAVNKTRDRDLVLVSQGVYDIAAPIEVPDLIEIFAALNTTGSPATVTTSPNTNSLSGAGGGCSGNGVKVVLRSATGLPIFHVTGAGSPTLFPVISGFILGGSTSFVNPGAIQLDGASYAQVQCNIIGQEDLPNVIGVLLRDADNVFIHDNTIHGSSQFPISPILGPSPPVGGFGIVTSECLGSGHSDDALILNNLLALNSNAGILLCSDGAGGHLIILNTVRGNGRGIVLREAVDVVVAANAIQDNYYDGIELLETAANNIITNNSIESHDGINASGILLQGNGTLFPLNNAIVSNFFRRNKTHISVVGARRTLIGVDKTVKVDLEGKFGPAGHIYLKDPGNVMTADGARTDIVLALGNPTGQALNSASPTFGQPSDTIISTNTLLANGPCTATRGCAIRLMPGVTVTIDATHNEWGVTSNDEIRAEIWDKYHDSALGQVLIYNLQGTPVATPTMFPTQAPPLTYAPVPFTNTPTPTPNFPASATPTAGAAASGPPPPPTAFVDPATGHYYVELTVCVTDSNNQPVPNDRLALTLNDPGGGTLGVVSVQTSNNGCFSGDVGARGGAGEVQPGSVSISDPSGGVTDLPVGTGSPLYRPPSGTLLSS